MECCKEKICLCCLGNDHYSEDCQKKNVLRGKCGVQNCDKDHHKFSQYKKKDDSTKRSGASGQDGPRSN